MNEEKLLPSIGFFQERGGRPAPTPARTFIPA